MGGFTRTVPTSTYFASLGVFYDGDYRAALMDFLSEGRGGIKNGQNSWIDSICYNTMAGECYYQLGQYGPALNHYTNALNLYVAFNNWMLRVQFDPAIRPAGAGSLKMVPWGGSKRVFRLGSYKETHAHRPRADQQQHGRHAWRRGAAGGAVSDQCSGDRPLHGLGHAPTARVAGAGRSARHARQ